MRSIECREVWRLVLAVVCVAIAGSARPAAAATITVETAPKFFNPTVGQRVAIRLKATEPVPLEVEVVDRDGVRVRSLGSAAVQGESQLDWNGRDDSGEIVPDEAYGLRLRRADTGEVVHDPAATHEPISKRIATVSYSKQTGILSYELAEPSRVHIQAGQARVIAGSDLPQGPVLYTVVDRAPRAGGRVVESWNGWDDSREYYVAGLPHFAIGILATSLPPGSLITIGNRNLSFPEYVSRRGSAPSRTTSMEPSSHHQHRGLTALEDRSPRLRIQHGGDGSWSARRSAELAFSVDLEAESSAPFLTPGNQLHVFLGIDEVLTQACTADPCEVRIPASSLSLGRGRLAVNWASGVGPVAIGSHWLEVE